MRAISPSFVGQCCSVSVRADATPVSAARWYLPFFWQDRAALLLLYKVQAAEDGGAVL